MKNKVISKSLLLKKIRKIRKENKTVGFTNGCFDIIHPGHIDFISRAKKQVDFLILGLNSDSSVKAIKGKGRPINDQVFRAEPTPYQIISFLKPDYLFKGSDWKGKVVVGRDILKEYGGKVRLLPYLKGYSTTSVLKKICRKSTV